MKTSPEQVVVKATKKDLEAIKKTTNELLKLMGMAKAAVTLSQKEEEGIWLNINYPDPEILIGSHGETISSLQLVLSLMVYKRLGRWQKIVVNVGDYLEKRAESLKKLALNTAQRVKFSGKEVVMPYLNSAERRLIHLALVGNPDVMTESIGEGRERRLLVRPKK
jgi:spoIIIJ-associated protein